MCLILFAYRSHPHYELILAANRDEFYARPSAAMQFWEKDPDILAGRDLQAGGTWLGVHRSGRLAAITNVREPKAFRPTAPSRGALVSDFLRSGDSAMDYAHKIQHSAQDYNGFNLLLWDGCDLCWYSNRSPAPQGLTPGIYGLSNHLLNTPWPKVAQGRQALAAVLQAPAVEPAHLLPLLTDHSVPVDAELPDTGVGIERERMLAPRFIVGKDYGTRCSTALTLSSNGELHVLERNYGPTAAALSERHFSWVFDRSAIPFISS